MRKCMGVSPKESDHDNKVTARQGSTVPAINKT